MISTNLFKENKGEIKFFLMFLLFLNSLSVFSQGRNHTWLLGYTTALDAFTTSTKARLYFDTSSVTLIPETRKLAFRAAQGNISDENGNLLMATNGCWIANSTGDTMQNGSGLNPNSFTSAWCTSTRGIPTAHSDVILPFPNDSTKYVLFHQTGNYSVDMMSSELYYTIIDKTLDNGLGGVIQSQKNLIAIQDTLNEGIAVCKHANGRDWWIVVLKDSSDIAYKLLLTPAGIASISMQHLNVYNHNHYNGQPAFSPDGTKFSYSFWHLVANVNIHDVRIFDFDRCSGMFSNAIVLDIVDGHLGLGLTFSPNSKYVYASSCCTVFQIDINSLNLDTVAINDGFASPNPPLYTDFWLMYPAANGKIYITSGNSVTAMHYINAPDSGGLACDVQQHALVLPCYVTRANVYHPNYYLGPVIGSICDSLSIGVNELPYDFHYSIAPNPTNGSLKIIYLLPQNKSGVFDIYDLNGRKVFEYALPQWSTLQNFNISSLTNGVYTGVITSNGFRTSKKIVVIK